MSAPMAVRVAALRLYLLSNHRILVPNRKTASVFGSPGIRLNEGHRYLSSEPGDKQIQRQSNRSSESDTQNYVNPDSKEADDFFGIEENLRYVDEPVQALPEDVVEKYSLGDCGGEGDIVLGQERVLGVNFGYIRRDSDNPAIPRSSLRHRTKLLSQSNPSREPFEPADFLSRLVASERNTEAKSSVHGVSSKIPERSVRNSDGMSPKRQNERANITEYNSDRVMSDSMPQSWDSHVTNSMPPYSDSQVGVPEANFIDEQYFDDKYFHKGKQNEDIGHHDVPVAFSDQQSKFEADNDNHPERTRKQSDELCLQNAYDMKVEAFNFIDEQYFEPINRTELPEDSNLQMDDGINIGARLSQPKNAVTEKVDDNSDMNFVDDQYFSMTSANPEQSLTYGNELNHSESYLEPETLSETNLPYNKHAELGDVNIGNKPRTSGLDYMKEAERNIIHNKIPTEILTESQTDEPEPEDIVINKTTTLSKKLAKKTKPNLDDPQTAYDMAMKIRLENTGKISAVQGMDEKGLPKARFGKKLDSHGFRILKDQVPDWTYTPREVLAKVLRDSIIYDDNDIVVIDKPYGLPSHGGPGVASSVGQLTPLLAQLLDKSGKLEKLHLIHRLDKETTGVMILARTPQMAWQLRELFRKRQVVKKYWLITKGVPNPTEGIIDIPMGETTSQNFHRMCLRPNHNDETKLLLKKTNVKSSEAVTEYKVLSCHSQCALVECRPITGVKHQLRVHMAHGLNTPILGDHKYSHFNKLAPQKLYPEILHRLAIRQSKVRHLAMHLHAKVLILPEFLDGRNLVLSTRLPRHFVANMKKLKLNPSSK